MQEIRIPNWREPDTTNKCECGNPIETIKNKEGMCLRCAALTVEEFHREPGTTEERERKHKYQHTVSALGTGCSMTAVGGGKVAL